MSSNLATSWCSVEDNLTHRAAKGSVIPVAAAAGPSCCPVIAWQAWRTAAGLHEGPAFRSIDRHGNLGDGLSDRAVGVIHHRTARRAGLDPTLLSTHSLRAGYVVTTTAQRGHSERAIAKISCHHSVLVLGLHPTGHHLAGQRHRPRLVAH